MTGPAATATCAVCAQPLHAEVNAVTGETQMVADDGWGTVCGDAPEGEHVPDAFARTQPEEGTLGPRLAGPACTRIVDGVQTTYRVRVRYSTAGRFMRASTKVRYDLVRTDVTRTVLPVA